MSKRAWGLLALEGATFLKACLCLIVSAALSVPCRHGSSASKLSAQLMTSLLHIYKAARPRQLHASVGGILKVSH